MSMTGGLFDGAMAAAGAPGMIATPADQAAQDSVFTSTAQPTAPGSAKAGLMAQTPLDWVGVGVMLLLFVAALWLLEGWTKEVPRAAAGASASVEV